MDITNCIYQLLQLTRERGHCNIHPLPGKTWEDCFDVQCGMAMLHYHVEGDKSSKAVYIIL